MADKKISQLTALSAANLAPSTDVLAIVDTSATETKKIVAQDLVNGVLNVASAVGIGTASPTDRLNVGAFSGNNVITIGAATTGISSIYFGDGTGADRYRGYIDYEHTNDRFAFGTAGTGKAYLDSSGNLGLGVTPSGWGSGFKAFQTSYMSVAATGAGSGDASISWNAYNNGTNWIYQYTGGISTRYRLNESGHAWYTAPSGTAGNAVSFTQAMTLDASGNLLVGTTTLTNGISGTETALTLQGNSSGKAASFVSVNAAGTGAGFFGTGSTTGETFVFAKTNHALVLGTNNTERGRFTAGGYFKASNDGTYVNATSTQHEFRGNTNSALVLFENRSASTPSGLYVDLSATSPNNTTQYFLYCEDSTAERAAIRSNGGLANYQTNDVNLSDERVKTDIAPLGSMWAKIKALEIVTFKYKDQTHDDDNIGLIAQQVESVAPEFVDVDGWGETPEDGVPLKSIYTADMYHAAIKALQEAMARIESLEAKVSALEAQ